MCLRKQASDAHTSGTSGELPLLPILSAQIAQLVEQRTENPRVTGSIPVLGTFLYHKEIMVWSIYGRLAQVVEHLTFNQVVEGSSPSSLTLDLSLRQIFFYARRPAEA